MNAPISTGDLAHDLGPRFEALYRQNYAFIWRCARRMCIDESEVEDVIQDVFVIAYRRLGTLAPGIAPSTWLFGIMRNVVRNRARGRGRWQRRVHALARDVDASEQHRQRRETELGERVLAGEMLHAFLRELDESQRSVFVLAELEGHSAKEIAEALAIKPNTASSRLRLARRAFCVHFGVEPSSRGVRELTRPLREHPEQPDEAQQSRAWGLLVVAIGKPGTITATGGFLSLASAKFAAMFGGATVVAALTVSAVQVQPQAGPREASDSVEAVQSDVMGAGDGLGMPSVELDTDEDPAEPPVVVQAPHPRPRSAAPDGAIGPAEQLRAARTALVSGDPERALALLESLDQSDARLLAQRTATQVAALCKLGEVERARLVVEQLRGRDPSAAVLAQIDRACW
jgi:RNA polymerase sigma factor (sigma-70 family)